jgi:CarS bacterial SH3 domain
MRMLYGLSSGWSRRRKSQNPHPCKNRKHAAPSNIIRGLGEFWCDVHLSRSAGRHRVQPFKRLVKRNPIYCNVSGAPLAIGDRVRIVSGTDETFDPRFTGRIGLVRYLEYECGCGQSFPHDPMIGVGFHTGKTEEFWREELKRCSHKRVVARGQRSR